MSKWQQLEVVAVLLPTYTDARHVEQQVRLLKHNDTKFMLHWVDEHSTDSTRDIARSVAPELGTDLRDWHQSHRLGVPDHSSGYSLSGVRNSPRSCPRAHDTPAVPRDKFRGGIR